MCRLLFFVAIFIFLPFNFLQAETLTEKLSGRILLQVNGKGEAWYVSPVNLQRYFLGRPKDAFNLMRKLGTGISNQDLEKIPVNLDFQSGVDSDYDGLSDNLEIALGTSSSLVDSDSDGFTDKQELSISFNLNGHGNLPIDLNFSSKQKGKIFLQVGSHGEAWYINPSDGMRYYLGRPADAFSLMRTLGLGIANENLALIPAETASHNISDLESKIFEAINQQRISNNLRPLIWNDEVAKVAREHSQNLADENESLTQEGKTCDYPIIHQEGLAIGDYSVNRLNNRGLYYFSMSGENIALVPAVSTVLSFAYNDPARAQFDTCVERREVMEDSFKSRLDGEPEIGKKLEIIKTEDKMRLQKFNEETSVDIDQQRWHSSEEVVSETVQGWMNSPGNKANILEENFDEGGTGIAKVGGYFISTQVFIKRISCGYKDAECCHDNKNLTYCYSPCFCQASLCQ